MWFIKACQDAGALQLLICITSESIFPSGVAMVVLFTCSGMTRICSYAAFMSANDQYLHLAAHIKMASIDGNGAVIFFVFAFRALRSMAN